MQDAIADVTVKAITPSEIPTWILLVGGAVAVGALIALLKLK